MLALQGRWGVYTSQQELDALVASLDTRGVRELALHEARALSCVQPLRAFAQPRALACVSCCVHDPWLLTVHA